MGATRLLAYMVSLGLAAACSSSDDSVDISSTQSAVVYGTQTIETELYGTVGVGDAAYGYVFCTGTLIAPNVVVTAAHCVTDYDWATHSVSNTSTPEELMVVAGVVDAWAPADEFVYDVVDVIVHEGYHTVPSYHPTSLGSDHDIAILVLAEAVVDENVAPVNILPMSDVDTKLTLGTELLISGYGTTDPQGEVFGGVNYSVNALSGEMTNNEIIVGGPGANGMGAADSCYGDSGGPVYHMGLDGEIFLIGATSRGADPSTYECGFGGIYTLVPAYVDWIEEVTGGAYTAPVATEAAATLNAPSVGADGDEKGGDEEETTPEFAVAQLCAAGALDERAHLPWLLTLMFLVLVRRPR
jgi:secreted trypsin-like serine protease